MRSSDGAAVDMRPRKTRAPCWLAGHAPGHPAASTRQPRGEAHMVGNRCRPQRSARACVSAGCLHFLGDAEREPGGETAGSRPTGALCDDPCGLLTSGVSKAPTAGNGCYGGGRHLPGSSGSQARARPTARRHRDGPWSAPSHQRGSAQSG